MNFTVSLLLAFIAGMALGILYYAGLWMTVQHLPRSSRPGLLATVSLFLRLGSVLVVFYLAMGGRWERLLVCVAGFLLARFFLVRQLGPGRRLQKTEH